MKEWFIIGYLRACFATAIPGELSVGELGVKDDADDDDYYLDEFDEYMHQHQKQYLINHFYTGCLGMEAQGLSLWVTASELTGETT